MTEQHTIATTVQIERRLRKMEEEGIQSAHFKPDAINYDRTSNLSEGKKDKKTIKGKEAFKRLLDPKFRAHLIHWLTKRVNQDHFMRHRFFASFPDDMGNYDDMRAALLEVGASLPNKYICTNRKESPSNIKKFVEKEHSTERPTTLVLSDDIPYDNFFDIMNWATEKVEEILILESNEESNKPSCESNKANYALMLKLAKKYPGKLHLHGIQCKSNKYHNPGEVIATILICSGFGSVCFVDGKMPRYLLKKPSIRNRAPKSLADKLSESRWIDDAAITYPQKHPEGCSCLGENDRYLLDVAKRCGLKSCLTHHIMDRLSFRYRLIREYEEEKQRVLKLESLAPTLEKLI